MSGALFNHLGLVTRDLALSVRFYTELFGFEIDRELEVPDEGTAPLLGLEPPIGLKAVYLRQGEFQLELMALDQTIEHPPRPFNELGLTHFSVSVDDVDATVGRVEDLGGEVVRHFPLAAMVRDPDGQLLEILPMSFRSQR